ncbi:6-bladed beta-propeller protein [Prolixibacter denitrificans]|nr:6-bladed beta-propeller protein [Prolixibacter denitrificans]
MVVLGVVFTSCMNQSEKGNPLVNILVNVNQNTNLDKQVTIQKIVPLDSMLPIGKVRKLSFYDGHYYLLDKSSDEILCYDGSGHFKFKIADKGKGPSEYIAIQSFYVDPFHHWLNIISVGGKVLKYTPEGMPVGVQTDSAGFKMVMNAAQLTSELTACYGLGPKDNLYVRNQRTGESHYFIPFIESRDMSFSNKAFAVGESSALFCHGTNDSIYEISAVYNVKARYYVDFGANRIDPKLYQANPGAVMKMYQQKDVATKLDDLNNTPNFLLFSYLMFHKNDLRNVSTQFVMYDKKKKSVMNLQQSQGLFPVRDITDKEAFISLVSPVQILSDGQKNGVEKQLSDYLEEHHINEESNPLVVVWKMAN